MDKRVGKLIRSIKNTEESLNNKITELETIQDNCDHIWPMEWMNREEERYYDGLNGHPTFCTIEYKICTICCKEKTKE